jgi:hypothetical protein
MNLSDEKVAEAKALIEPLVDRVFVRLIKMLLVHKTHQVFDEIIKQLREDEASPAQAVSGPDGIERDAELYRWGIANARWIRHEHEAYVAIPVSRDADLSCQATRDRAIKASMLAAAISPPQKESDRG